MSSVASVPKESNMKVFDIPLVEIFSDDEFNCRGKIAPIDVVDLAKSIEDVGLQSPITVQPYDKKPPFKFRIIAGHRRFTAFKILDRDKIPAMISENLTDLQAKTFNLVENLKRQDLNPLQEAKALIVYKKAGWVQEDVAKAIGMSRGWVQVRYMLLDLPEPIQKEAAAGFLNQDQIRQIYSLDNEAQQYEAVKIIKERRERGDHSKINLKKPKVKPLEKRERKAEEMFLLQERIQSALGNNIGTRLLGWAAGVVSDFEIHRDLKEYAESIGKRYDIPREVFENL